MPALGMSQDSGVLVAWLKQEGDSVVEGEPLMEIETDKVTVEIEAPASGTLAHVTAAAGEEIPVGQTIAWILAPGESVPEHAALSEAPAVSVMASQKISPVAARMARQHDVDVDQLATTGSRITRADVEAYLETKLPEHDGQRIPASPKARRLAKENGIDLAELTGSGPDGAILTADVLASRSESQPPPVSRAWRIMAHRLEESWRTIPHFYLRREVDASRLVAWRAALMKRGIEKITYTDLLVKLVAQALHQYPQVNAMWLDDTIVFNDHINIGLAVAVEDGLVVPVIHDADRCSLAELASRRETIVARAHDGKLSLDDIQGGTFTISNLGMYGVDSFSAIVNPPQAAILAVGRIADRAVPVNGQLTIRPQMTLNLSCDHRVVDGARGAKFLDTLAELIEEPLGLLG
ncbi:MAG: 2-oxo acid dehydrogenase subunit E2 [Chloroflexi bacterium]|nr:2-oxo acid dehydrogenase subunit E2 [Chloroflexota bacterium]